MGKQRSEVLNQVLRASAAKVVQLDQRLAMRVDRAKAERERRSKQQASIFDRLQNMWEKKRAIFSRRSDAAKGHKQGRFKSRKKQPHAPPERRQEPSAHNTSSDSANHGNGDAGSGWQSQEREDGFGFDDASLAGSWQIPALDQEQLEKAIQELASNATIGQGKAQVSYKIFDLGGQSTFYIFHPFFLTE